LRKALVRYGATVASYSLLASFLNVADRFLIGRWRGLADAGTYAAIYDVVFRSFGLVLFPIAVSAFPLLARAWNSRDWHSGRKALRYAILLECAIGLPLLVIVTANHTILVQWTSGHPMDGSRELVFSIGLAAFLWQLAQLAHKPAELSGHLHILILGVSLALIVNVVGNVIFLRSGPLVVAGITSALASTVYVGFILLRQRRLA
jgi:O-antigen/teichoic acid export membrane protein